VTTAFTAMRDVSSQKIQKNEKNFRLPVQNVSAQTYRVPAGWLFGDRTALRASSMRNGAEPIRGASRPRAARSTMTAEN